MGWHLTKRRIRFWHSRSEKVTEMDFIPIVGKEHLLIECKVLSVSVSAKQLSRTSASLFGLLNDGSVASLVSYERFEMAAHR